MITVTTFPERGLVQLGGGTPNGSTVVQRVVDGFPDYTLRGGVLNVTTGGFVLEDSEAPLELPLQYRAAVTPLDRVAQQNLVLTPTMKHGRQGWTPGTNRTLSLVTDPSSNSGTVAQVTPNPAGVAGSAPPTVVGQVSSATTAPGSYTLTPATSGGTAIANGDWMVWAHQQLATAAAPTMPAGWTLVADQTDQNLIRLSVWTHKRVTGETSYSLTADAGAASIGTLTWVRSAIDTYDVGAVVSRGGVLTDTLSTTDRATTVRPGVVLSVFAAQSIASATLPTSGSVTGGTWVSTASSTGAGDPRSLVVAKVNTGSQLAPVVSVTYADQLAAGMSVQIGFMVNDALTDRIIARIPIAALPGDQRSYRLTGRVKFLSPGVSTWQDIKNIGTWQAVKTARANWLAVRGVNSSGDATDYLRLFASVTNPANGADYVLPVQAIALSDSKVNTWVDFSILFRRPADVPAGAEIRLLHGSTLIEYGITWFLDEIGLTPPTDLIHETMYFFSGDSPVPANPQDFQRNAPGQWPVDHWEDRTGDATVRWSGVVGNSVSVFTAPSRIWNYGSTILQAPDICPSEPVLLSDPVDSSLAAWASLQPYNDLVYPAHGQSHEALDRADPLITSRIRGWPTGTISVLTRTSGERELMLAVLQTGRILLLRTPYREYPENDWYLWLDNLTESRPLPNQRESLRVFTADFTRVARPDGLIAVSTGARWSDVVQLGTWGDVKAERSTWLDVILAGRE